MTEISNFHSHTTYCDGRESAETMLLAAIGKGLRAYGFSGHSHTGFEPWTMDAERAARYRAEVLRLREKYCGEIEVYLGVEQDLYSDAPTDGYDFVIGSTHNIIVNGEYRAVDSKSAADTVAELFGGDWYAFAADYFAAHSTVARVMRCDIAGHFDLPTKYNEGSAQFDETDARYMTAAVDAMREILKDCNLFEVNTGAMFSLKRSVPYPAPALLRELRARGGEVIISSDAHSPDAIGYRFRETEDLLRECGFRYRKTLSAQGFVGVKL